MIRSNFTAVRSARLGAAVLLGAALLAAAPAAEAGKGRHRNDGHRDRVVTHGKVHTVHSRHGRHAHRDRHVRNHRYVRRDVLRYGYDYELRRRDVRRRHFRHAPIVAPVRIVYRSPRYDAYVWGRVYHRGHGHDHRVYRFPVRIDGRVVYRAYAYCDGELHAHGRFTARGPRFDLTLFF